MPRKPTTTPPRPARGGTDTLRRRGLVQVLCAMSPAELHALKRRAAEAGMPVSHFLRWLAANASKAYLED